MNRPMISTSWVFPEFDLPKALRDPAEADDVAALERRLTAQCADERGEEHPAQEDEVVALELVDTPAKRRAVGIPEGDERRGVVADLRIVALERPG